MNDLHEVTWPVKIRTQTFALSECTRNALTKLAEGKQSLL